MQAHTEAEGDALLSDHYAIHSRLWAHDDYWAPTGTTPRGQGVLIAESVGEDPFLSGSITADLDQPLQRADYRLNLGRLSTSLSPYMDVGVKAFASNRPLLDPGIYLRHETKCVPFHLNPAAFPWRPVFIGRIDRTDPASDGNDVVAVQARDVFVDYMTTWIEPHPTTFDHLMPEAVIESTLLDLLVLGVLPTDIQPQLAIQGTPNMLIPSYYQPPGSTLLAMRQAGLLNAWDLRGRWAPSGTEFELTYYEPDRALAAGPQFFILPERYISIQGLAKDRTEVRNIVQVVAADAQRSSSRAADTTSIANYGPLYMGIFEDELSRITTLAQASQLSGAILSDTKDPKVQAAFEVRYQPFIEVNDVAQIVANGIHHDNDIIAALSGFTHTFHENGDATTLLRTRDRPAAANQEWRDRAGAKTQFTSTSPPTGSAPERARWSQVS